MAGVIHPDYKSIYLEIYQEFDNFVKIERMEKDKIKIESKYVDINGIKEKRYFAETRNGFDGTAQGYGYKSKQKIYKAYWYFENKDKIKKLNGEAHRFLKDNIEIKKSIKTYFEHELLDAFDTQTFPARTKIKDFLKSKGFISNEDIKTKLNEHKHLWKSIEKIILENVNIF